MTFSMTCTCGDTTMMEADTREEAVAKMKEMMNDDAIAHHMAEKHPNEPVMTVTEAHVQIEQNLQPAA